MDEPLALLIVDGHPTVRAALAQWLGRVPGVAVVGAVGDIAEAVRLIRRLAPDAVLYEPRTVAEDPAGGLRALAATGQPVVVWTASLLPGEAEALRGAGAAAVLLKGTDTQDLLRAIEAAAGASPAH